MSMNLHAKTTKEVVDLRQTPTYITYMCLMTHDGVKSSVRGKDAIRALRCYLEYCSGQLNRSWSNRADLDEAVAYEKEHRVYIESFFGAKGLEVYYL